MEFAAEEAPARFLERTRPLLLSDEARHNLILGIAGTLVEHPDVYRAAYLWLVEHDGEPVCAGLMTPPFNAVVSAEREEGAVSVLAHGVRARSISLPGVIGALPESERFADAWTRETSTRASRHMTQGIYSLTQVRAAPAWPGQPRRAESADRELLLDWVGAFQARRRCRPIASTWNAWLIADSRPPMRASGSGKTTAQYRWPDSAGRPRTASGSVRSSRLRRCAAAAMRPPSWRRYFRNSLRVASTIVGVTPRPPACR